MKALVLGSTGLIGSHVVRAALDAGHEVRAMRRERSKPDALEGLNGAVEVAVGDIRRPETLATAVRGCDWVFHAAAYYPTVSVDAGAVVATAVTGMRSVLDACVAAGVSLLVFTSSLSTIGPPGEGRTLSDERDFYVPGTVPDPYYEAKWAMECEAYRYLDRDLPIVIVNPTICLGPGNVNLTSGRLVRDLAAGRLPAVVDGKANVVDVRDVARGHVRAAERGTAGERYILGNENTTLLELSGRVARLAGVAPPRLVVPAALARAASVASEYLAWYVTGRPPLLPLEGVSMIAHGRHYDVRRAREELDLPQTPVDVAIQDTIDWFRAKGMLRS